MLKTVPSFVTTAGEAVRDLFLRAAIALGAGGYGVSPRPDRLWKAFALVLPIALFVYWIMPRYTWVMSPSIDATAVREAPGPIVKGDLVMFMLNHPFAGPEPIKVTKYALCFPGEHLSMTRVESRATGTFGQKTDAEFRCNGELMNVSKSITKDGRRIHHWEWSGDVIPDGYLFVGSRHPDGFDSRYFGLVARTRLTRAIKVL